MWWSREEERFKSLEARREAMAMERDGALSVRRPREEEERRPNITKP
jgi:hypothetical protein